jgi:predicted dehydrogenase
MPAVGLRFGLLGTGHWAAETQAAGLARHPEAELVGVWGRRPARAAEVAARCGARAFEDVDDLIAAVDAVAIALPPDVQAELAVRAAEAGRHLLLDKPMALSTAAADRVVAAVERNRLASVVFFTNRFFAAVDAFLRAAAAAGGWDGARVAMLASIFQPGNPYAASPWRRERGGLWDVGPHALSIVLPVLGPVAQVAAMDGPRDTVHLLLGHTGGATSTVSLTLDAPPAATARELVFYGGGGTARVPEGDASQVEAFVSAIDHLLRAASGGPGHPYDARFGREVVAVLDAADRARREAATVRL